MVQTMIAKAKIWYYEQRIKLTQRKVQRIRAKIEENAVKMRQMIEDREKSKAASLSRLSENADRIREMIKQNNDLRNQIEDEDWKREIDESNAEWLQMLKENNDLMEELK